MIPLPEWVDQEMWDAYVAQRIKDRKPMSVISAKGRLKRLLELKAKGYDANACLEQSLNYHWLDFWPCKQEAIPDLRSRPDTALEEMRQARQASQSPESHKARQMALSALKVVR